MAVTTFIFGKAPANMTGGETGAEAHKFDWISDDVRLVLLGAGYAPGKDTHEFYSDLIANEIAAGGGYVAGGAAIANRTTVYDAATDQTFYDGDDVNWPASDISARYGAIVDFTPATNATRPILQLVDFGALMTSAAGNFLVQWNAAGIFKMAT